MADLLQEFFQTLQSRQAIAKEEQVSTLRDLQIGQAEQAAAPGSLENLTRQRQTIQEQGNLANIGSAIETQAQTSRQQEIESIGRNTAAQIDAGTISGQEAIDQSDVLPPGTKFTSIPIDPSDPKSITRPGFILPGDDEVHFMSTDDQAEAIKFQKTRSLAKAKKVSKPAKGGKRPDKVSVDNVKASAVVDERLADLSEEDVQAFSVTVANKTQAKLEENPNLSFDQAQELAYEDVVATHIIPADEGIPFVPFTGEAAKFSRTPVKSRTSKVNDILGI